MTAAARRGRGEEGVTLVEILVAVSILGIAVVTLTGGIGTAILGSDIHRKQATSETLVRSAAESMKAVTYSPCPASYPVPSVPTGFSAATTVSYWNGTAFAGTCPTPDTGLQRISISISSSDGRATESVDILKRDGRELP